MADNVIANAGAGGATFATDERVADSVHFPLTKLVWGALDTFTLVAAGASAIPIQDGGNQITVDGTVSVDTVTNLNQLGGQAIAMGTGARSAGTQRVTIATDDVVPVTDNAGSLTVDAPVGTPVFVRLSDGAAAISTLPVSLATVPSHAVTNAGTFAVQNNGHGKTFKSKTGSNNTTFSVITAPGASKKIKVYGLSLITASTTAVTITFKDGVGGTAIATYPMQAITGTNFGIVENVPIPSSLFECTANTALEMSFSAAQTVYYNIRYWDDDAT